MLRLRRRCGCIRGGGRCQDEGGCVAYQYTLRTLVCTHTHTIQYTHTHNPYTRTHLFVHTHTHNPHHLLLRLGCRLIIFLLRRGKTPKTAPCMEPWLAGNPRSLSNSFLVAQCFFFSFLFFNYLSERIHKETMKMLLIDAIIDSVFKLYNTSEV
jgi:hypothetical protein